MDRLFLGQERHRDFISRAKDHFGRIISRVANQIAGIFAVASLRTAVCGEAHSILIGRWRYDPPKVILESASSSVRHCQQAFTKLSYGELISIFI